MKKKRGLSNQTRRNWLVDAVLFLGAVVSAITGIYFLFFPVGGYQGGRNPFYGITILFQRETWEDLHTWFGILMIVGAAIHIILHWDWIVKMTRRSFDELTSRKRRFNSRSRFNVGINIIMGLSFLVTALSGLYLFLFPGGRYGVPDPGFLFNRTTWDLIHTWAGIIMVDVGVLHFIIHWGWVVKVTRKMMVPLRSVRVIRTAGDAVKLVRQ